MSVADREKWNKRYREGAYARRSQPSALLQAWVDRMPGGRALDVACGAGRNALYLAARGFQVEAVDISSEALERGRASGLRQGLAVEWLERDLDAGLAGSGEYQLILMVRYVNMSLLGRLVEYLAPGGFLVCEQHLVTSADVIGPGNPAYRVQPGDLAARAGQLHIHHLEEGLVTEPDGSTACLARLVAQKTQG